MYENVKNITEVVVGTEESPEDEFAEAGDER
jgi:hypothetical protein